MCIVNIFTDNVEWRKNLITTYVIRSPTYINADSISLADGLSCPSGDLLKNSHGIIWPRKKIFKISSICCCLRKEIAYLSSD